MSLTPCPALSNDVNVIKQTNKNVEGIHQNHAKKLLNLSEFVPIRLVTEALCLYNWGMAPLQMRH